MDVDSLRNPGRRARVREVWEEGWKMSTDPIIAWELAWGRTREVFKQFQLDNSEWSLPASLTLQQLHLLAKRYSSGYILNDRVLFPVFKKLKYTTLLHLQTVEGQWRNLQYEMDRVGISTNDAQKHEVAALQEWLVQIKTGSHSLQSSPSWRWARDTTGWKGWLKPTRFWNQLLSSDEKPENLTDKWPDHGGILTWNSRWKKLWSCKGSSRTKLWVWRTLKNGFFTGERAERMRVSEEPYTIDEAIETNKGGGSLLNIVATMLQFTWKDRNLKVFQNREAATPIQVILTEAKIEIEGEIKKRNSPAAWGDGRTRMEEITYLIRKMQREGNSEDEDCSSGAEETEESLNDQSARHSYSPSSDLTNRDQYPPSHEVEALTASIDSLSVDRNRSSGQTFELSHHEEH
ncbi:hypothetical protein R1sor_002752 [Riccia sorocarpa]|uniref:Uncharacterized protein n=1 Tax=Riccia sorocarpa TaxID=122646 RepID=A0ABD3H331_9MARC